MGNMKTQNVNSIRFGAQIRFVSTKVPKKYSNSLFTAGSYCVTAYNTIQGCIGAVSALSVLLKKINNIRKSIKLPS